MATDYKKEIETRNARAAQERVENIREIAESLYHWNSEMLFSEKCLLLPGDVCICGQGGLTCSRGAYISMDAESIADLVDGGALSKIFNPDDLNAPDFEDKMAAILHEFQSQRHFHDASCFYHSPELGRAVAVYDVPGATPERDAKVSVERCGSGFELAPRVRYDVGAMAECDYETFNPGGVDILEQLNGANPERQNQTSAYEKLMAAYQDGGSNDVPELGEAKAPGRPEDIPGYDSMCPAEKLRAQSEYLDAKAAYEQLPESETYIGPRLPGQGRYE